MKQYVFTMKDDVCTANGKTEAQKNEVLKVLTHYGTVEDYDTVLASERARYQQVIDNQTKQIEAIKEQELTIDEIKMVKAYREGKSSVVAEYVAKADAYAKQLEAVKVENEQRVARIKQALGE